MSGVRSNTIRGWWIFAFNTYIEQNVLKISNIKNIDLFQLFIKLCAGRIGRFINIQDFVSEVGVSSHTIEDWLSILEASFIKMPCRW